MIDAIKQLTFRKMLVLIFIIGCVIKFSLFLYYGVQYNPTEGDDPEYRANALKIISQGILDSQGERPPMYPFFLASIWWIFGENNILIIIFVQNILGILTALIWSSITWMVTKSEILAFLSGLICLLNLPIALLELRLLTEPLSSFLFSLSIYGVLKYCLSEQIRYLCLSGIVIGLLGATRVSFGLFSLVPLLVLFFSKKNYSLSKIKLTIPLLLPSIVCISFVVGVNWYRVGYPTLSTWTGYNLTNTICQAVDSAPEHYEPIKSIFIRNRDGMYRKYGGCSMTIWQAREEMTRATNLSFADLGKELQSMSLSIIKTRPAVYARSVLISSLLTLFDTPVYVGGVWIRFIFQPLHYIVMLISFISIGFIIGRENVFSSSNFILRTALMLFITSAAYIVISSSLFEFGETGRYRFPINMIFYILPFIAYNIAKSSPKESTL